MAEHTVTQSNFNPRSREGSDKRRVQSKQDYKNFNPRSREGSDQLKAAFRGAQNTFQSTLP